MLTLLVDLPCPDSCLTGPELPQQRALAALGARHTCTATEGAGTRGGGGATGLMGSCWQFS